MSRLIVVGIGADGWAGLADEARTALRDADRIVGSERQFALVPERECAGQRRAWPSPIGSLVDELVDGPLDGTVAVLASGDPMLHGIGATLSQRLDPSRLTVIPHPSAFSLACARMRWPAAGVELISVVAWPVETIVAGLQHGRRIVTYVTGADGAATVAAAITAAGYGPSAITVLEQLGSGDERRTDATAATWCTRSVDPLHVVAIECVRAPDTPLLARTPGLPDDAYDSDGQLTKRHVRAVTLAALGPAPRARLWDVGAGSGSIAIEWLRAEPTATAVAIERDPERAGRIERNARSLGVPALAVIRGDAPEALRELDPPDAAFIGGGVTAPGIVERCWQRLSPGGRLVANAVTLESERALLGARERLGGTLTRIEISHAEPVGSFTGWRAQMPVTQWRVEKPL